MYEKELSSEMILPSQEIYNMISGLTPEDKRRVLVDVEQMINS